jgi:polyvinyl alcohol dehydrogenase (cytochrome)
MLRCSAALRALVLSLCQLLPAALAQVVPVQPHGDAAAPVPDPARLYADRCARCHAAGNSLRAPLAEQLRQMSRVEILRSLESGKMKEQGAALTPAERRAVSDYLGIADGSSSGRFACTTPIPALSRLRGWNAWGGDLANSRAGDRLQAGDAAKLRLKWAFAYPGATVAAAQPTLVDGVVFTGSASGTVYALDAQTGCEYWRLDADAQVRTAPLVRRVRGRLLLFFGDTKAQVYAVEARSGKAVWKMAVDAHPMARITGSPAFLEDRLYVPVASAEEVPAGNPKYPCCTFRGSVVALEAETGRQIWKTFMIPEAPAVTGKNSAGTDTFGPSGAAIWLTPTIDSKRGVLYVGTGNGYTDPPSPFTDSIVALKLATGERVWHRQMTPNDRWNVACGSRADSNCPTKPGKDFDFGAPVIIATGPDGRTRLLAGQKSGMIYALDPGDQGQVLWQVQAGTGGLLGGIEWGMAAGNGILYAALSDWVPGRPGAGGGLSAFQIATGERLWHTPPPDPACKDRRGCSAAQMAPVTLAGEVAFSGSMDGHLRAYSAKEGKILWDFDTLREFETVNGVKGSGGSFSAAGPVVVDGMVFVQSGYSALGGMPGNLLLAFEVAK